MPDAPAEERAGAVPPRLEVARHLPAGDVERVLALVDAAAAADGVAPLSEHVLLHLRHGGEEPGRHVLLVDDADPRQRVVGYGHLDPTDAVAGPSAELVVAPDRRRAGLGTALVRALERESPGRIRLWAHGTRPQARDLAASLGYVVGRELWQLRRDVTGDLPRPELPPGVSVRTFEDSDVDDLLELNAEAFADHPEQGDWTEADLATRMSEPWFDPGGLFLAADRPGRLLAFHWTKVHGDDSPHGHAPIGEVYVVGVSPRARGRGLGRAMTLVGLHHLRGRGLGEVLLYVDAGNPAAVRTYTSLGFRHHDTDVQFTRAS
ncbi:MAG: mycothiol synthase [Kineosporiaceae bacterium]